MDSAENEFYNYQSLWNPARIAFRKGQAMRLPKKTKYELFLTSMINLFEVAKISFQTGMKT
jgi:hypothetical protein